MANRPQGVQVEVVTSDTELIATSVKNKNVYFITVAKINKDGDSLLGEKIVIKDSETGTKRWGGSVRYIHGDHFVFSRYGLNCPKGIYVQFTGSNIEATVGIG